MNYEHKSKDLKDLNIYKNISRILLIINKMTDIFKSLDLNVDNKYFKNKIFSRFLTDIDFVPLEQEYQGYYI